MPGEEEWATHVSYKFKTMIKVNYMLKLNTLSFKTIEIRVWRDGENKRREGRGNDGGGGGEGRL